MSARLKARAGPEKWTQSSTNIWTDFNVFGAMGWEYFSQPQGYDRRTGELKWTYRYYDIWYVPQFPGQLVAGVGSMGRMVRPKAGEAGEIWSTSSEKGAAYMLTADGLFLKTLGGDVRTTPLWRFPEANEIYVVTGKEHISVLRLNGLETVRRKTWGTITVTEDMLAGLPETIEEPLQKQIRKTLEVPCGGRAPVVDGKLDDWADVPPEGVAEIDHRTKASLWIANGRIYGLFRTGDPKLLENSATDPRYLFKFGGALDLYFGAKWNHTASGGAARSLFRAGASRTTDSGWFDFNNAINAFRRSDGEYLIFAEDDGAQKVLMYRWRPAERGSACR